MDKKEIVIDAFNPYEARFPNRTVISREELHLIKILRQQGIDYRVRSKYGGEIYILSQKNFESLLVDPMFLTLFNISISIVSAFVYDLIKGKKGLKDKLFLKNKDGEIFNYEGKQLDRDLIKDVTDKMLTSQQQFGKALITQSPYNDLPYPIHLEHTPQIVGWCNLVVDERGLRVDPCKVICDQTWDRIQSNDLKGLSIGGLISKSNCGICGADYRDCNHITGNTYDDVECVNEITKFDLAEVSIVTNPANNLCGISLSK